MFFFSLTPFAQAENFKGLVIYPLWCCQYSSVFAVSTEFLTPLSALCCAEVMSFGVVWGLSAQIRRDNMPSGIPNTICL